jgi:hypothetical protein
VKNACRSHARAGGLPFHKFSQLIVMKIKVKLWIRRAPKKGKRHVCVFLQGDIPSLTLPAKGSKLYIPWGKDDPMDEGPIVTESDHELIKGVLRPVVVAEDFSHWSPENECVSEQEQIDSILKELNTEIVPYITGQGFKVCFEPEIDPNPLPSLEDKEVPHA